MTFSSLIFLSLSPSHFVSLKSIKKKIEKEGLLPGRAPKSHLSHMHSDKSSHFCWPSTGSLGFMKRENRASSHRLHQRKGGRDFLSGKKPKKTLFWFTLARQRVKTTEQENDECNSAWKNNGPSKKHIRLFALLNLPSIKVTLPPDSVFLFSATSAETPTSRVASEPQLEA